MKIVDFFFFFFDEKQNRHLTGEIGKEFEVRADTDANVDDLLKLAEEIVPFNMTHNAEHEAADLLLEIDQIERVSVFLR